MENPMENLTLREAFNSMDDNQKAALYAIVGYAVEEEKEKTKRYKDRYSKKLSEVAKWKKMYEFARLQLDKEED